MLEVEWAKPYYKITVVSIEWVSTTKAFRNILCSLVCCLVNVCKFVGLDYV